MTSRAAERRAQASCCASYADCLFLKAESIASFKRSSSTPLALNHLSIKELAHDRIVVIGEYYKLFIK